jgi:N-terminal acetyltransferase B complex non-catalytic subunit
LEFISLEDQLENSLQRDLTKLEHVRMRLSHEPITPDLVDLELIELKLIFDRGNFPHGKSEEPSELSLLVHHDNRDFDIIPNYQPRCGKTFGEQTLLFGKSERVIFLWVRRDCSLTNLHAAWMAIHLPQDLRSGVSAEQRFG